MSKYAHLASAIVVFSGAAAVYGADIPCTTIFDMNTLYPGTGSPITSTASVPSISAGNVSCRVEQGSARSGIVVGSGGPLTTVVERGDMAPGSAGPFDSVNYSSISGNAVAFVGTVGQSNDVFTVSGGQITPQVVGGTVMPGGKTFATALPLTLSLSGSTAAFVASHTDHTLGVYATSGGVHTLIANANTPIPGGPGNFTGFFGNDSVQASGSSVAFLGQGSSSFQGAYFATGGTLTRIADTNTQVPAGLGTFRNFQTVALTEGTAVIVGGNSLQTGVYAWNGTALSSIARTEQPVPGAPPSTRFTVFTNAAVSGSDIVFSALTTGGIGLYGYSGSGLYSIIGSSDTINGRRISQLLIGEQSIDSGRVVFRAKFNDNSWGVFTTSVPTPGSAMVLSFAGMAALRRRR